MVRRSNIPLGLASMVGRLYCVGFPCRDFMATTSLVSTSEEAERCRDDQTYAQNAAYRRGFI